MTRDEILAMVPGEEMDELVAIKVMGKENNKTQWGQRRFAPSTDLSAAWEVVEKMHQDERWNIAMEWYSDEQEWAADFDELGMTSQGIGKTAPEAICKAALLAVLDL